MDSTVLYDISYGVYILSAMDGDRPTGCLANSVMQVTAVPETIAVSVSHGNFTNQCIEKTGKFSISILSEKAGQKLIGKFGFKSGRDINKFEGEEHKIFNDLPVYTDKACGWITCDVVNKMESDTHTIFLGRVTDAEKGAEIIPMTYDYYHKVIKGKSPVNAPTYRPEEGMAESPAKKGNAIYKCGVCGYVYKGEVPFEELPDSYKCPVCKQPKSVFVKMQEGN
ncbi:flavin reductase [Lachnospiraceae bacterium NSJ-143]|nr:flavin reductase [Lachnospiraceae bacterium NSJ-143]